jgi:hypothetical protein
MIWRRKPGSREPNTYVKRHAAGPPCNVGVPLTSRPYFGGVFVSAGGGVELVDPFGLVLEGGVVLSEGGMGVVVPGGEVD